MFSFLDIRGSKTLISQGTSNSVDGIALPTAPEPFIRPCIDQAGNVVGKGSQSSNVYALPVGATSWRTVSTNAVGDWASALNYSGQIVWQEVGGIGKLQDIAGLTTPVSISGWDYQSQGIRDITPANAVVMDDGSQLSITRRDGSVLQIPKACQRGNRIAGEANNLPGGDGIIVYDISMDVIFRCFNGDPQGFPCRLDDDGETVAISGTSAQFINSTQWTQEATLPPKEAQTRQINAIIYGEYIHPSGGGKRDSFANCWLDVGSVPNRLVSPNQTWNVADTEQGQLTRPTGDFCCWTGTIDSLLNIPIQPQDLILVQACPLLNESLPNQSSRYDHYVQTLRNRFGVNAYIGLIPFVRTNFTLTDLDIANGLIACSQFRLPQVFFEFSRPVADVPIWVPDWLSYQRNGQVAPVAQPSPYHPPTSSNSAAAILLGVK